MSSWKEKKGYLVKLIKKLSDHFGGDELEFLKEYMLEVINKYTDELDTPITCFEELVFNANITKKDFEDATLQTPKYHSIRTSKLQPLKPR